MASFNQFIEPIQKTGNDGRSFELFVRWFLKIAPDWSTQIEKVWLWNDWPDRWGPDCGIDLVFRSKQGDIWAVQAKCYNPKYSISKRDIDTFLSESTRSIIYKRLLITTTDQMSQNAIRTCNGQEKPVVRYMLKDFEDAVVDYPTDISKLRTVKPRKKPKPRDYQRLALKSILTGFQKHDRGQLIMACGTGKTFTTLWVKEKLKAHTTLVLLPSLSLLSQTLREWTAASKQSFDVLCICSDQTVAHGTEDMRVGDAPFPVTSQINEISDFLKTDAPKVVFCTYHSSDLIAQVQKSDLIPAFDLVVADEAHRCAGKSDASFTAVLDKQRIKSKKKLFTTATPRIFTSTLQSNAEDRGIKIFSMDNVEDFGIVFYTYTFGQAIVEKRLTDYRLVIVGVDEPMVKRWIVENELVSVNPNLTTDARSLASKIGILKVINDYDVNRIISFHSTIKGAKVFSAELQEIVPLIKTKNKTVWTDYVSGAMPTGERRRKLNALKFLESADFGILSNARCLSEGVNVPSLDGVAFIDPKRSQTDIVQAVGRVIRKNDDTDKDKGTIIIPVFVESGDNIESVIEASRFKPVWDVVKALRSHDEVLGDELDQFRTDLGRGTTSSKFSYRNKIVFDLPRNVDSQFADSLSTRLVEATTSSWNFWFGLLEQYVSQEANALVPAEFFSESGFKLGSWVSYQRNQKIVNKLSQRRTAKLESVKGWSWEPLADLWEEGFRQLTIFAEREAHANPKQRHISTEGYKLGAWVHHQRKHKNRLTSQRIIRLEVLPSWSWDPIADQWERGFEFLVDFVKTNGHALVPVRHKLANGYALGAWLQNQRASKRKLDAEAVARLEALDGWSWDPVADQWERGFGYLAEYVDQKGDAKVTRYYETTDGFKLGVWVSSQITKREKLAPKYVKRLEALEGWTWNILSERWEDAFEQLTTFIECEGHALVPYEYKTEDEFKLGSWVSVQRKNKNRLSKKRRDRLEGLKGWVWNKKKNQWDRGFECLTLFVKQEGHSSVPRSYKTSDGLALGNWVGTQRRNKDKLPPARLAQLESLGGWVWNPHEAQWEKAFEHLVAFVEKEGHARVPRPHQTSDGFSLGSWVSNQKGKKTQLSKEKVARLESLNEWVWSKTR